MSLGEDRCPAQGDESPHKKDAARKATEAVQTI